MIDTFVQTHKYKLFSVGAIATFMATLDGSILNVALPTIADYFHISVDVVAWVVLAYSLTLISLMLVFSAWTGKKGYFFAYRFSYVFFILGSLICAFSSSIYLLIFGRVVEAVGTAMFAAIGPGMVTYVFPENERGKGMGLIVMMVSAGFMVGPPLGGFLLHLWSWQLIFMINIPIGFVGLYMTYKYFRKVLSPLSKGKLKWKSPVTFSLALVTLILALSLINDYSLVNWKIIGLGILSLLAFSVFLKYEINIDTAIIGFQIFKNKQFTVSILTMLLRFIATSGIFILIPFYLERIKHFGPEQVGLFLIILPILMFIFAPVSGRISDKIGYRFLTSLGMIILIAGLFLLTRLEVTTGSGYIILALVVVGMGTGIFNTPNSSALMGSVQVDQRAATSGILGTTRNIGISIGVALATSLFAFYQNRLAFLNDSNEIFLISYHKVIFISMMFAIVALPFCLTRENKLVSKE
ncbi:MAG: MFS transporter [FCB group bacterium]|nr:MFS transporter [FCB group bacterium]